MTTESSPRCYDDPEHYIVVYTTRYEFDHHTFGAEEAFKALQRLVNDKISQGYRPLGGASSEKSFNNTHIRYVIFYQPMIWVGHNDNVVNN